MSTEPEWTLLRLLGEVVGSGPRSAEDMDAGQARSAFRQILRDVPDPTTLGAFLLANRWKRNTPEELAAFLDVMIESSVTRAAPAVPVVDCGANYDGKERTALLGVAAGIVAAACSSHIVVHSGDRVPTKEGCAYKHVLQELGIRTDLQPETSARMVEETGFGFYHQPRFNPGIHALLGRRRRMGVRTAINTIETLANPASGRVHLGSFYHLEFGKKLVQTVEQSERAGFDRVVLFQGLEGYDDVRPGHTTVAEWEGGAIEQWTLASGDYGSAFESDDLTVTDVRADSTRITREVLAGERTDRFREAVVLNAALRLYAGGQVSTIEAGIESGRDAIDSGKADERLEDILSFSGGLAGE